MRTQRQIPDRSDLLHFQFGNWKVLHFPRTGVQTERSSVSLLDASFSATRAWHHAATTCTGVPPSVGLKPYFGINNSL